jgi:hypothetical protein
MRARLFVRTAMRSVVEPPSRELVALECARLDLMLEGLAPAVAAGELSAIDTALKVSESRRKLLGLDALPGSRTRR